LDIPCLLHCTALYQAARHELRQLVFLRRMSLPRLLSLNLQSGRVLTLGDGDCAYSAALATARSSLHVCATTYDTRRHVPDAHVKAVAELLCELDFTDPFPEPGSWDRIVANFPTPLGRRHVSRARSLMRRLLACASESLAADGQFWLTLEVGVGGPSSDGMSWDVVDAAADVELILITLEPAKAKSVYAPRGSKTDGTLHVFARPGAGPLAYGRNILVRDISLEARGSLEALNKKVASVCAPIETSLELLSTYESEGRNSWTIRLELSTTLHALSRRKAHALCESIEKGIPFQLPLIQHPRSVRRQGWAVWFHRVEPSIEDFLSLMMRPVERAEDASLLWTNATWAHPSAFVNHFDDAVLNKRDVALLLRGSSFIPRTFVLPDEFDAWASTHAPYWISKPARLGRGVNVVVFQDEDRQGITGVVSEYIHTPLLISGRKVDLRLYVLLRSCSPLEAFVHENGYVRFAALQYSLEDLMPQRHLTNNAINRAAGMAPPPLPDQEVGPGDNWPLRYLWNHVDRSLVWTRVKALLLGVLTEVAPQLRVREGTRPFALLGFDVLLSSTLEPWLCEINSSPTLEGKRSIDRSVDTEVIGDLLHQLEGDEVARWERLCAQEEVSDCGVQVDQS